MFKLRYICFLVLFVQIFAAEVKVQKVYPKEHIDFVFLDDDAPRARPSCDRKCIDGAPPRECRYQFAIEWYYAMSKACYDCPFNITDCYREDCVTADGVPRAVVAVNRQIPGPTIEVCLGDKVIIDVENHLGFEDTTIHWHGFHQKGSPYMDGVPMITQCPISPSTTFRYKFDAANAGTHFWHSHLGHQRGDGAFGSFIVRVPDIKNRHRGLYDFDKSQHVVQVLDWNHRMMMDKFLAHYYSNGDNKGASILVNGKGRYENFSRDGKTFQMPVTVFDVQKGYRYRFRMISGGFVNCPIEVSVDNHTMTIISSDGNDIEPVEVESLVIYAGERYDFVLSAGQAIDAYWMRFRGLLDCGEKFTSAHQVAVIRYEGANITEPLSVPSYNTSHKEGTQMNPLVSTHDNETVDIPELNALDKDDASLKKVPDYKFYISFDFKPIDHPKYHKKGLYGFNQVPANKRVYTPQMNQISFAHQKFTILPERHKITPDSFCNETSLNEKNCTNEFCECTHVLQVPLHSVVELILIDEGVPYDANHPFHLHGHFFRVVAMDRIGSQVTVDEIRQMDNNGLIKRKLSRAPLKDTVTVPDGGYTVVRFIANNPGYWLLHCHIEFHVELGMLMIFKVGEDNQMPPVPKDFPSCGSWTPSDNILDDEFEMVDIPKQEIHPGIWRSLLDTFNPSASTVSSASSMTFKPVHKLLSFLMFLLMYAVN